MEKVFTVEEFLRSANRLPSDEKLILEYAALLKQAGVSDEKQLPLLTTSLLKDCGIPLVNAAAIAEAAREWVVRPKNWTSPKNFLLEQKSKFESLSKLFQLYMSNPDADLPEFFSLPDLGHYPKLFQLKSNEDYLVRKSVLHLFSEFEQWFQCKEPRSPEYGLYFAGPEGVGKSVAVYFCACLAYSLGWTVVYFPNCEDWVLRENKEQRDLFVIETFERCLVNQYDEPTNTMYTPMYLGSTWGELIKNGRMYPDKRSEIVSCLWSELYTHKSNRVLLIADEINAIYSHSLVQEMVYCSTISGRVFANGYKLLSGTGTVNSGKRRCLRYFQPPSLSEFQSLVKTSACSEKLKNALSQLPDPRRHQKIIQLAQILGRVPRVLVELSDFIERRNPPSNLTAIEPLLEEFLEQKQRDYFELNQAFIRELPMHEKPLFFNGLMDIFTKGTSNDISDQYLDLSLIYQSNGHVCCLNSMAAGALINSLCVYWKDNLVETNDAITLLKPGVPKKEKGYAFERQIQKSLLIRRNTEISWKLLKDGTLSNVVVRVMQTCVIAKKEIAPPVPPSAPTLMIPEDPDQPVYDILSCDGNQYIIWQISTTSNLAEKMPAKSTNNKKRSYNALLEPQKWRDIRPLHFSNCEKGTNFAEALMYKLLPNISDKSVITVTAVDSELEVRIDGQATDIKLYYAIFCPTEFPDLTIAEWTQIASEFPWIRLVTKESLQQILSTEMIESVLKS